MIGQFVEFCRILFLYLNVGLACEVEILAVERCHYLPGGLVSMYLVHTWSTHDASQEQS